MLGIFSVADRDVSSSPARNTSRLTPPALGTSPDELIDAPPPRLSLLHSTFLNFALDKYASYSYNIAMNTVKKSVPSHDRIARKPMEIRLTGYEVIEKRAELGGTFRSHLRPEELDR